MYLKRLEAKICAKGTRRISMKVVVINNDGSGFADNMLVEDGAVISTVVTRTIGSRPITDYIILVNRETPTADQILYEGDKITITPKKIIGA